MTGRARHHVTDLRPGDLASGCQVVASGTLIAYLDPDSGTLRVGPNRCRHQGGRLAIEDGCVLRCPRHEWRLDASTMRYVNPTGDLPHPEYEVETNSDGSFSVYAWAPDRPWEIDRMPVSPLRPGELTIRFWSHACAEISCSGVSLWTDPWLEGPAFTRGWWLAHRPPGNWLEELAKADAIYVSHNHSDHLNPHTLTRLAERRADIPVFVPAFDTESCERLIRATGLTNVLSAPFHQWLELGPDSRFMILPDGTGREDSGVLVDHKGHLILNTVDCADINGGELPEVDVLLTSFAGAASGYPVCWGELYSTEEIGKMVDRDCRTLARSAVDLAVKTRPKIFVPFAGYYVEAHPSDADIKALNRKNPPEHVAKLVRDACPTTVAWCPGAGDVLDVATAEGTEDGPRAGDRDWSDEFATYLPLYEASLDFAPLQDLRGVAHYFEWAGFKGDLLLHVIETDDGFDESLREFHVDFRDGSVTEGPPADRGWRYLRMRVRADAFRFVLQHGLPWEEISIGAQARFYREPDHYNFDFWDHMQNELPITPPRFPHVVTAP